MPISIFSLNFKKELDVAFEKIMKIRLKFFFSPDNMFPNSSHDFFKGTLLTWDEWLTLL